MSKLLRMKNKSYAKSDEIKFDTYGADNSLNEISSDSIIRPLSKRSFLSTAGMGVVVLGLRQIGCQGSRKKSANRWKNPFAAEIALSLTSEGGMSRMAVSWDTPGDSDEKGRIRGQKGSFYGKYEGLEKNLPGLVRPPLPPGVNPGGH